MRRSLLTRFHPLLEEGAAYRIEKLSVGANDVRFPTTSNRFKLSFISMTNVTPIQTEKIPINHFQFMPFPDILSSSKDDLITGLLCTSSFNMFFVCFFLLGCTFLFF